MTIKTLAAGMCLFHLSPYQILLSIDWNSNSQIIYQKSQLPLCPKQTTKSFILLVGVGYARENLAFGSLPGTTALAVSRSDAIPMFLFRNTIPWREQGSHIVEGFSTNSCRS
jgi:hypothetical protein